ncbi:MAG: thioredoxin domain-containing protein [Bacteroidota bacterium]
MRYLLPLAVLTVALAACSTPDDAEVAPDTAIASDAPAPSEASEDAAGTEPVMALLFAADWCSSCERMDPALTAAREATSDLPIQFVVLDHTDDAATAQAAATAEDLGVADLYAAQGGGTGFVLLVSRDTGAVIDRIVADDTQAEIEAKLTGSLPA